MKHKTAALLILVLVVAMLSPLIARCGSWQIVHEWESPEGTFGLDRPLRLSAEEFHAYVDPLRLYEEHRIVVTDGGYAYITYVDFNFFDAISSARVEWHTNYVTFSVPSWITISIPKVRIISQIGN